AHESPKVMYIPLIILAVFAIGVGWKLWGRGLTTLLEQARPAGTVEGASGAIFWPTVLHPAEHASHEWEVHKPASIIAFSTALAGFLLATAIYAWKLLKPAEISQQFRWLYNWLWHKWYFDEFYNTVFVQPVLFVSRRVADFDKQVIDRFIDGCAVAVRGISIIDDTIDRWFVDGLVNRVARVIHSAGISMRRVQTGYLRQYIMFIVIGTVALFILISFFWSFSLAG